MGPVENELETFKKTIRLILIGKTGSGKSSTGNTILGEKKFKSGSSPKFITSECQFESAIRFNRRIDVVDTPGLFDSDTKRPKLFIFKEVSRAIVYSSPCPHAVLLCVKMGRFSEEDVETAKQFLRFFGPDLRKYVIFVFTHFDQWELAQKNDGNKNPSDTAFLSQFPEEFQKLFDECGKRYILLANHSSDTNQAPKFINDLEEHVIRNEYRCYTDDYYKVVERELEKEIEKRLNGKEVSDVDKEKYRDKTKKNPNFLVKILNFFIDPLNRLLFGDDGDE